jgi:hypothetical protein
MYEVESHLMTGWGIYVFENARRRLAEFADTLPASHPLPPLVKYGVGKAQVGEVRLTTRPEQV